MDKTNRLIKNIWKIPFRELQLSIRDAEREWDEVSPCGLTFEGKGVMADFELIQSSLEIIEHSISRIMEANDGMDQTMEILQVRQGKREG